MLTRHEHINKLQNELFTAINKSSLLETEKEKITNSILELLMMARDRNFYFPEEVQEDYFNVYGVVLPYDCAMDITTKASDEIRYGSATSDMLEKNLNKAMTAFHEHEKEGVAEAA